MEKKPTPQQCIASICEAIEHYCNSVKCPSGKSLDDVEAMLMIFFRKGRKCRIHLIGEVAIEDIALACAHAVQEASMTIEGAIPDYAA